MSVSGKTQPRCTEVSGEQLEPPPGKAELDMTKAVWNSSFLLIFLFSYGTSLMSGAAKWSTLLKKNQLYMLYNLYMLHFSTHLK